MRTIDADELKEEMSRVFFNDNDDMKRLEELIDNAPTVKEINLNDAILFMKVQCQSCNTCIECPMNHNCNEQPTHWNTI